MKKTISLPRRSFMKAAAGFTGAGLLGGLSFKAFAQAASLAPADHCFVFAYFNGGWDVLLSLDPRDPATFKKLATRAKTINKPEQAWGSICVALMTDPRFITY